MNRERGQALIEATLALPVCALAAATIIDCGVIVRDRLAVSEAATRAAEARLRGDDPVGAARSAIPSALRGDLEVELQRDRVTVRAASAPRVVRLPGGITHVSSARDTAEVIR